MYDKILLTLEATPTDRAIIEHIKKLAKTLDSRVALLHVATGVPAKYSGPEATGEEIELDRAYLATTKEEFQAAGISAETHLAYGEPVREIVKWVEKNGCDLVAMATHGHGLIGDILLGTTASPVQHQISVPVLLLRAK